jgi:hypothetical protein
VGTEGYVPIAKGEEQSDLEHADDLS